MADPDAEYNGAQRQAKAGDKRGQRRFRRLEKRRVKALGQRKKKSKEG
jgi:hypothetical protein